MDRFAATLRALAAPRRSVPIALVVGSLIATQIYYGRDPLAALVPAAMVATFLPLGPWSWRVLLGETSRARLAGAVVYGGEAIAVVALCCVALPQALGLGPTFLTVGGSLVIAIVLFVVGGWGLGRDIELESRFEDVRLKAIQTHLDPHFLYNTLNAIAEWCAEDPKVAEEATLRLAAMLRDILDGLESPTWPLARELALVEDLLELHRIRDAEAFTVQLEIDEAATGVEVPPLVLVSLAENAVKHGPRKQHRGAIVIRVAATAAGIRCEIENPGPFAPAGTGRGLATLRARLARYRATLSIAGAERTLATLELRSRV